MLIKPYQKYNKTTKERYSVYPLCESYGMHHSIHHRIIVSFGKLEALETVEQKKMLAPRIEELIKNGGNVLETGITDERVEELAHYFYTEIKRQRRYDIKHEKAEWNRWSNTFQSAPMSCSIWKTKSFFTI